MITAGFKLVTLWIVAYTLNQLSSVQEKYMELMILV
jgi:hypothetical protein